MKTRIGRLCTLTLISLLALFGLAAQSDAQDSAPNELGGSSKLRGNTGKTHKAEVKIAGAQSPDSWSAEQPPSYVNRSASVVVNGEIYVFGGDAGGDAASNSVYDPATNQWTVLAPTPILVAAPTAAVVNGLIYLLGGYDPATGTVYTPSPNQVYNPSTNSWSTAASPNVARAFATAQAVGNKIYLIGGYPGGGNSVLADTEQFDPVADTWSTVASMPTARDAMVSAAVGSTIYVIGGNAGSGAVGTNEAYDTSNNVWGTMAPMPTARSEFGAALLGGNIYAFGGCALAGDTGTNEEYDPSSDSWVTRSPIPVAMCGHTGAAVNGLAYSIGINRTQGNAQVNYAYTPLLNSVSVTLTSTPNRSYVDQSVTFTAVVSGSGPIPTGSVTFQEGKTTLGTVTLANGQTTLATVFKKSGSFSIVADYSGDQNYGASNSNPLTQVVQNQFATTTTLSSSFNPSTYGQPVTLIATVSSVGGPIPTGTVTFKNGSKSLGSATLSDGGAQITTSKLPVGNLAITASYSGDAANKKSTSPNLEQVVNPATSATAIVSSVNPSNAGQTVKFTATVTSPTTVPTGTVTFMDGSTVLGTGNLAKGKASFSTSALSAGSHNITAVYQGTSNITGSTSPVLVQTVK